jgi:hypothetical protein
MADLCPLCGLNRELVGVRHNCRPSPNVVNTVTPVVNSVVNTADRRALYRERNRALCNARSREAMAKKRGSTYCLIPPAATPSNP